MNTSMILTDYIQKELAIGRTGAIKPDDDLLGTGVLDSVGVWRLVLFIEEQFSIKVPDKDVVIENFQSVAALTHYLENQKNG